MEGIREMDDWECESSDVKFKSWWKRQSVGIKAVLIIACVLLGLGAVAGLFTLFGHIVMWLWNWIMPYLFDLPTIDFWMAWGIVALSMILFGRASGSSESGSSRKRKKKIKASMKEMPSDGEGRSTRGEETSAEGQSVQ